MEGGEDSNLTKTSMPLHVHLLSTTKCTEIQRLLQPGYIGLDPSPPPVWKLFVIEL